MPWATLVSLLVKVATRLIGSISRARGRDEAAAKARQRVRIKRKAEADPTGALRDLFGGGNAK